MIIEQANLSMSFLKENVAIITGAGRGIGYEAAKALAWLGAKVIIAEIDETNGKKAENEINREFGKNTAFFVRTDIGKQEAIATLSEAVLKKFGRVDIVLNNATVFSMGAVKDVPIESWDNSYQVNLKGPLMLARRFLPAMIERKHGVYVCVSSSGAVPFMGAYEVFKTAQVELAATIAAEVENTGVYAFTIGPGISRTPGFIEGGGKVASLMGMSLDELFELNQNAQISPEAAGAGFALAIAQAKKYHGQETSSIQVLREAGISFGEEEKMKTKQTKEPITQLPEDASQLKDIDGLYQAVLKTYVEQSEGWKKRNLFERQWVARDFKKNTGMSIDEMLGTIKELGENLSAKASTEEFVEPLRKLAKYYAHQQDQLRGFEKDLNKLNQNLQTIADWISKIDQLIQTLSN